MIKKTEFLIIGSGVAGMSYALKVANAGKGKVVLICKTTLEEANTAKAQGGIASVTNLLVDNFEKHIEDTMIASSTFIVRADTQSSASSTMPTTPERRSSAASWKPSAAIPTSKCRRTTLPWRLSRSTTSASA